MTAARKRHPLTPQMIAQIAEVLRAANYLTTAARAVGVPYATLLRWQTRGRKERAAGMATLHAQLVDAIDKGSAEAETHAVSVLNRGIEGGDWRAAEFFLARRFPQRWGRGRRRRR